MSHEPIIIAHLYPDEMNIYGDEGNIIALTKRLEWRGHKVEIRTVRIGELFDFGEADIIFGGGGQDRGQQIVSEDLYARGDELRAAANEGKPILVVCGLYQLFGHSFTTSTGFKLRGIGVFDATTMATDHRMIGNIVLESSWGRLVGFENHSGATTLGEGQKPLGKVVRGYGNNTEDKHEGAVSGNAIGTYLHGSLLPKNPRLADFIILQALKRKFGSAELPDLDDNLELRAADSAAARPQ